MYAFSDQDTNSGVRFRRQELWKAEALSLLGATVERAPAPRQMERLESDPDRLRRVGAGRRRWGWLSPCGVPRGRPGAEWPSAVSRHP